MEIPSDLILQKRLQKWSGYLIYAVGLMAIAVLIGWEFDIDGLKRFGVSSAAMNPLSAVCFLAVAGSYLLIRTGKTAVVRSGIVLAVFVLLVGLFKFISICFNFDLALDTYLFSGKLKPTNQVPFVNRMAVNSSICFIFTGLSLLSFRFQRPHQRLTQWVSILIAVITMFSILGHLYQVKSFHGILFYVAMAPNTALCFLLIALAFLFAQPGIGFMKELTSTLSGSSAARILLPTAIIIPTLLGMFRVWGYWNKAYEIELGATLFALFTILFYLVIILINTRLLNKRDILRSRAEQALYQSEEENRAIFENGPDAIVLIDDNQRIVKWNKYSAELFGWTKEEVMDKRLFEILIPDELVNTYQPGLTNRLQRSSQINDGNAMDLVMLRKNGSMLDISLSISPLVLNNRNFFIGFIRDITERKQLEKRTLRFNEELALEVEKKTAEVTNIFERITDGFIALDKDFNYTYINKKAGEIIRMNPADVIGKNIWEVFPDLIGGETYNAFHQAMKTQQFVSQTGYYAPFDLWEKHHIYPSPDGLSIFIQDITESKKSEQTVNEARALADQLIDNLPGIFCFYDEKGQFIRWNKQFETVTGYTKDEILQMRATDFFPPEEQHRVNSAIEVAFRDGYTDTEVQFLTKSGDKVFYYFKGVRIIYEGKSCLLGSGIDISALKQATEELKASEQKYKLLFESNPLPMWMLSLPDYQTIEVNDATLSQYGYSRQEFLALDIFLLRPQEDVELLKRTTRREFRGIHHAGVWRHLKKNGTVIYVDIVTHDFYYEGKPTRLVLANEVTDKYLAEEKLKESYEATRKLTEYLQNVREEERLHMAREIHDELGQLLTILKMDISWLNKKLSLNESPYRQKFEDLLQLIDTIVKKVRHIASELRPSLLDDLGLVAAMEWHLDEFEKRSGIKKFIDMPEREIQLPDQLKIGLFRIMQESLTNVARHAEASEIKVYLREENAQLILTIQDNGRGIDENNLHEGKLGLLGMKERTKMMGGNYTINGLPGKGTTVKVIVPIPKHDLINNTNDD